MVIEMITATVFSQLHEKFENTPLKIVTRNSEECKTGVAIVRGIMVDVVQMEKGSLQWLIYDEQYNELEDLERNNCIMPWDIEEDIEDVNSELAFAYISLGMPEKYWRLIESNKRNK